MAALTVTAATGPGPKTLTVNTLSASDTVTFAQGDIIHFRNPTGGSLTATLIGADNSVQGVPGLGNVTTSGGITSGSIATTASAVMMFDAVKYYLQGVVTITGASGMLMAIARVE